MRIIYPPQILLVNFIEYVVIVVKFVFSGLLFGRKILQVGVKFSIVLVVVQKDWSK